MDVSATTTQLLLNARAGHEEASERLFAHMYDDLRRVAHRRLGRRSGVDTLDTTGLVHESYLRLVDRGSVAPADRAHFLALAARAMRFVLIDRARARTRQKRGGAQSDLPLDEEQLGTDRVQEQAIELLALNDALDRLQARSTRLAEIVEYRFFGGLEYTEIAEITGRSVATLERDWVRARLWLFRALQDPAALPAVPGEASPSDPAIEE